MVIQRRKKQKIKVLPFQKYKGDDIAKLAKELDCEKEVSRLFHGEVTDNELYNVENPFKLPQEKPRTPEEEKAWQENVKQMAKGYSTSMKPSID